MKTHIEQRWKNWIHNNLSAGCSKEDIRKILLDEGFSPDIIEHELNPGSHMTDLLLKKESSVTQATTNKSPFNQQWQDWIQSNLDAGCAKDGIFKILLDEGFDYQAIKRHMAYEPAISAVLLRNPLKTAEQQKPLYYDKVNTNLLYLPNAIAFGSENTELYSVENFLTEHQCDQLIEIIKDVSTSQLTIKDNSFGRMIDKQICDYIGIDASYADAIQAEYLEVGQQSKEYRSHFDAGRMDIQSSLGCQSTYTVVIYLNDVEQGGETVFPKLGASFKPQRGSAVIWNNLNPDGSINNQISHHITPLLSGQSFFIKKCFKSTSTKVPAPSMRTKEANEYIPVYSKTGFIKQRFSAEIFKQITAFYHSNRKQDKEEFVAGEFIYNTEKKGNSSSLIELPEPLKKLIHDNMKPLMEDWCGQPLEPGFVYGIRIYKDKTVLKSHRDRIETHIIGAIINVDQEVNQDWPLVIEDNYYREHHVLLKPGEMLFYESARLKHGRPIPLNGQSFTNIFCHLKPVDYVPKKLG
jgi:prolyl 4-hydroxylase